MVFLRVLLSVLLASVSCGLGISQSSSGAAPSTWSSGFPSSGAMPSSMSWPSGSQSYSDSNMPSSDIPSSGWASSSSGDSSSAMSSSAMSSSSMSSFASSSSASSSSASSTPSSSSSSMADSSSEMSSFSDSSSSQSSSSSNSSSGAVPLRFTVEVMAGLTQSAFVSKIAASLSIPESVVVIESFNTTTGDLRLTTSSSSSTIAVFDFGDDSRAAELSQRFANFTAAELQAAGVDRIIRSSPVSSSSSSDGDGDDGLSPLVFVAIAAGGVLIIGIVVAIIVTQLRKRNTVDPDFEEYMQLVDKNAA